MKIKELLTDKSKWCKGHYAMNSAGFPVDANSPTAVSWCLMGALNKCYSDGGYMTAFNKLSLAARDRYGNDYVPFFNDDSSTTFDVVKNLVEELDV